MADGIVETKKFYESKTFWVNIIAMVALVIQEKYGFVIAPEEQVAVIAIINLVLRAITKKPLELK